MGSNEAGFFRHTLGSCIKYGIDHKLLSACLLSNRSDDQLVHN